MASYREPNSSLSTSGQPLRRRASWHGSGFADSHPFTSNDEDGEYHLTRHGYETGYPDPEDWIAIDTYPHQVSREAGPFWPGLGFHHEALYQEIPDPFAVTPNDGQVDASTIDTIVPDPFDSPTKNVHTEYSAEHPPELPEQEPTSPLVADFLPEVAREASNEPSDHEADLLEQIMPVSNIDEVQDGVSGEGFAKLLRRLRRNMNSILEKRIGWQNEQQKLERLRSFHKSSTRGMIAFIETERNDDEGKGSRKEKAKERKNKVRKFSHFDLEDLSSPSLTIPSSFERNYHHAATSSSQDSAKSETSITFSDFEAAKAQVEEDEHALVRQERRLKSLGEEMNNLAFRVEEVAQQIVKQMSSNSFIDELRMEMLKVEEETQGSDPKPETEHSTPEVVRKCLDWMGERGINLERLQELDFDHNEGLVHRDFLRDQGHELDVTDFEYQQNYISHREDITTRLEEAREKIVYYLRQCDEAGLDPEMYRKIAQSHASSDSSHESRSLRVDLLQAKQPHEVEDILRRPTGPIEESNKLSEIESWRQSVAPMGQDFLASIATNFQPPFSTTP